MLTNESPSKITFMKFPLTPRWVFAPGSAHAGPSARPLIDISGNFPANVSAESPSTNISHNRKLQTLVNKVLRSLTDFDRRTPVTVLHDQSNQLSVHQRCALYTLTSVQKAINMKQPDYSFSRFKPLNDHTNHQISRVEYKLSLSRGGYFYRGSKLYNQVPDQITQTSNETVFKTAAKKWVLRNIPVLPP
jgi:hypothetical protein